MREIVRSIAGTTDSTVHLANRLLTLARAGHGMVEGEMVTLSLTDIVRQAALELAPAAVKKGIDLALEADNGADISGNALLLHDLVVNLLDNAIHYTRSGGKVTLRVLNEHGPTLEVEDTGIGIAATERERVFAPFYRAASAQQIHAVGTGLGLAIVRDIVALHEAHIELADGASGGLKVLVRFPVP
jgi:two-component system sensor histidine kinase TctE